VRRVGAIAAAVFILSLICVKPGSVLAAYAGSCLSGDGGTFQTGVIRGSHYGLPGGSDITGLLADVTVRNVMACSSPTELAYDMPVVIPVTIEDWTDAPNMVQFGWGRCSAPSGYSCGGVPADGSAHFWYTCSDQSAGYPCLADSWAGMPVFGRTYRFRVQYNQLGTGKWDFSILNYYTGVTTYKSIASHWHLGDGAWFGAETGNTNSTMGPAHVSGSSIGMSPMEYFKPSVGAWRVVTDIVAGVDIEETYGSPSWYSYGVFSRDYTNDGANIYTVDH
jgi:hypothetical protein